MEDWDDFRYFLSVARNGNFSAAARELQVSQPTVARHISHLEQRLDVRLFDISGNGATLTDSGLQIIDQAKAMEAMAKELKSRPLDYLSENSGTVSVTTSQSLSEFWLTDRVRKFNEQFPEITVKIVVSNDLLSIENNDADLAIRFGQPRDSDLIAVRVSTVEAGIYGAPSYLEEFGCPDNLEDLKNHRMVGGCGSLARFPQIVELAKWMDENRVSVSTDCSRTYLNLAASGHGLITVPEYAACQNQNLTRVLAQKFSIPLDIWLLSRPAMMRTARVRNFMDFVKSEMKQSFRQS